MKDFAGQFDMYVLQKLLTHKSPAITQRYAHLRDDALKRAAGLAGEIIASALNECDQGTKDKKTINEYPAAAACSRHVLALAILSILIYYKIMNGKEVIKILKRNGWEVLRITGSHHRLGKGDARTTRFPIMATGTLALV